MLSVLLVDDHELVRGGLRALIEAFGNYIVVGEAGDGRAAISQARALKPELVLMDISMPELSGIDAIGRVLQASLGSRVIVLSMHRSRRYADEAFAAGALGYVVKDAAVAELASAMATVAAGGRFVSPALPAVPHTAYPSQVLTSRQREVLQLIAEGHTLRAIAERLFISVKTVETHKAQLMERLDLRNVASLTRYAIRAGLIDPN